MKIKTVLLVVSLFIFLTPAALSAQDRLDPQQHLKIQKSARMHGVHSEKLDELMRRMIATLMKSPADPEDQAQQARHHAQLVKLSKKVTMTAESINKYLPDDELDEEESEKFRELATQLHDQALHIQTAATVDDAEELNAALERFNQTCVSCHRLFREM